MKTIIQLALVLAIPTMLIGQTPNLGLTLPTQGEPNWGIIINGDLTIIDTFAGTVPSFPGSNGIVFRTSPSASRVSTYADVVALFGSGMCSGFLKNDGTCSAVTGGLTSFTSGSLNPLFTTSLGGTPTTAPALTFTLSNAPSNSVFGNFSGTSAVPSYSQIPVFSAAGLTNFPTFNQNTTGNATTATALAVAPTLCPSGQLAMGILANGNATGCSGNASTATALASTPSQCSGGTPFSTGIAANGNAHCTSISSAYTQTNKTGVYLSGVVYTNSSGAAALEEVIMTATGSCAGSDSILNSTIASISGPANGVYNNCSGMASVTFLVPSGDTFSATANHIDGGGSAAITTWLEIVF